MDFAKLCSHFAEIPVVNMPTSSATCAAYTPLSVRYKPDGRTVGSLHFKREIVCVGLLLQNYFNGEEENNEYLVSLMKKYGMPHTVSGVGASLSGEFFKKYYDYLKNSSAIDKNNPEECEKLRLGLEYLEKIDKGRL